MMRVNAKFGSHDLWRAVVGSIAFLVVAVSSAVGPGEVPESELGGPGIAVSRDRADGSVTVTFSRGAETARCKHLAQRDGVTSVRFVDCTPLPAELAILRQVPGLQELALVKTDLDMDHFQSLGKIEGLLRLSLSQSKYVDKCLEHLARDFPKLESLDLSYSSVTNDSLPSIAKLKSLRELSLVSTLVLCSHERDYHFGREGPFSLEALAKHPALERLDFGSKQLGPNDLHVLGTLPALTEIHFEPYRGRISGDDLLELKRTNGRIRIAAQFAELYGISRRSDSLGNIVELRDNLSPRAAELAETEELRAVKRFKIRGLKSFRCFDHMPAIRQLHLKDCSVRQEEWKHIAALRELETLVVERTPVEGDALEAFLAAPSLRRLSVDAKSMEAAEFKHLPGRLPNVDIRALESFRMDEL